MGPVALQPTRVPMAFVVLLHVRDLSKYDGLFMRDKMRKKLVENVCTQPMQVGSCSNFATAYWYNQATKQCQAFQYSGCFGNDNNFPTALACQNFCRSTVGKEQTNGLSLNSAGYNLV